MKQLELLPRPELEEGEEDEDRGMDRRVSDTWTLHVDATRGPYTLRIQCMCMCMPVCTRV